MRRNPFDVADRWLAKNQKKFDRVLTITIVVVFIAMVITAYFAPREELLKFLEGAPFRDLFSPPY